MDMLTTLANNPMKTANNATDALLATNPPGYTGGRLAAEQAGGVESSKGREQSIPATSLIARLTAEAQAARDAHDFGSMTMGGKRYGLGGEDVLTRADARFNVQHDEARWQRLMQADAKRRAGK